MIIPIPKMRTISEYFQYFLSVLILFFLISVGRSAVLGFLLLMCCKIMALSKMAERE